MRTLAKFTSLLLELSLKVIIILIVLYVGIEVGQAHAYGFQPRINWILTLILFLLAWIVHDRVAVYNAKS